MANDPWAAFRTSPATAPAMPRQPAYGEDPIIAPADPYKRAGEQRAQVDQSLQIQGNARSAAADARAADAAARSKLEWDATHNPDGTPKVNANDPKVTEFQAKSAGFLGRLIEAEKMFSAVPEDSRDARTMTGQAMHDWTPGLENSLPVWLGGNSADRQLSDQAARNFIAASLRQESGAAIGPSEYENQYRIFFPRPGDTPEVIKQKAEARRQAIEGFKIAAGPLAQKAEGTTQQPDSPPAVGGAPSAMPPSGPGNGAPDPGDLPPTPWDTVNIKNEQNSAGFGATDKSQPIPAGMQADVNDWFAKNTDGFDVNSYVAMRHLIDQKYGFPNDPGKDAEYRANGQEIKQYLDQGGKTIDTTVHGATVPMSIGEIIKNSALDNPVGAGATKYVDTLTGGRADELAGAMSALGGGDYTQTRDKANADKQLLAQKYPLSSLAGTLAGGLNVYKAGSAIATRVAPNALNALAKVPGAVQIGGGAAMGMYDGSGQNNDNRLAGGMEGAVWGGAAGGVFSSAGGLVNKLRGGAPGEVLPEVIAAGERQNIPIRQPDARPDLRGKYGAAESTANGGPAIRAARAADAAAIERKVASLGGNGTSGNRNEIGDIVKRTLNRQADRTKSAANVRYQRAEQLSGDPKIEPTMAIKKLAEEITSLQSTGAASNKAEIDYLTKLGEDLSTPGGKRISEVRNLRTQIRGQIKAAGLDYTQAEARAIGVLKAASADIEASLADNPRALKLYKDADKIWADRSKFRQEITKALTGQSSREASSYDTAIKLEGMMKRDPERFMTFMREMNDSELADLRATAAQSLGRNGKEGFSLPIFVKNLSAKDGMNPRTVKALFGDDGVKALADLRVIAAAKDEAASMTNYSRTANSVGGKLEGVRRAIWASLGFAGGGAPGAIGTDMARSFMSKWGEERAARMLLNPDFTKFLRNMPSTSNPKAIDAYFNRLGKIGTIAANDNAAFTNAIKEVFGAGAKSPGSVAASDQKQN